MVPEVGVACRMYPKFGFRAAIQNTLFHFCGSTRGAWIVAHVRRNYRYRVLFII